MGDTMSFFPIMAAGITSMVQIEAIVINLNNLKIEFAQSCDFEDVQDCFYPDKKLGND